MRGWPYPFGEDVDLLTPRVVGKDRLGKDIVEWDAETIHGCPVWPAGTSEDEEGRVTVTDMISVAVPFDAEVTAVSRFRARGVTYHVEGVPQRWHSPLTDSRPGCVLVGKVVTG